MKNKILPMILIISILLINIPFCVNSYASSDVVFYIRHVHTGDSAIGSGCYTTPVYHTHKGVESSECYSPIYHEHEGDPSTNAGCYIVPVLHYHTGDDSCEGGCYVPKYHEHAGDCYITRDCHVSTSVDYYTYHNDQHCGYHGDVTTIEYIVRTSHSSCGAYPGEQHVTVCPSCGGPQNSSYNHTYQVLNCSIPTDTIEGYILGCGHEEGDIDHYEPGCGMDGVIIGYELTCTKTANDIDGYEAGCGYEEGDPIAEVIVNNDAVNGNKEASLSVSINDLSNGMVDFSNALFTWQDSSGEVIGSSDEISVSANGEYTIMVAIDSPYVDQNSLSGKVNVDNIHIPGTGGDDGEGGNDGNDGEVPSDGGDGNLPDDIPQTQPIPTPTIAPMPINTGAGDCDSVNEDVPYQRNDTDDLRTKDDTDLLLIDESDNKSEKVITKAEKKNKTRYDKCGDSLIAKSKGKQSKLSKFMDNVSSFMKSDTGKVITVSVLGACMIGALFALIILLRNIALVYNEDSDKKRHLIGIVRIKLTEDGYLIDIPDCISEKAYSSRYEFDMLLFMIGRSKCEEILIAKEEKRICVKLERLIKTVI